MKCILLSQEMAHRRLYAEILRHQWRPQPGLGLEILDGRPARWLTPHAEGIEKHAITLFDQLFCEEELQGLAGLGHQVRRARLDQKQDGGRPPGRQPAEYLLACKQFIRHQPCPFHV